MKMAVVEEMSTLKYRIYLDFTNISHMTVAQFTCPAAINCEQFSHKMDF